MSSTWFEFDLVGPDPDEEEHVGGDNTEILEKETAGSENKGRPQ